MNKRQKRNPLDEPQTVIKSGSAKPPESSQKAFLEALIHPSRDNLFVLETRSIKDNQVLIFSLLIILALLSGFDNYGFTRQGVLGCISSLISSLVQVGIFMVVWPWLYGQFFHVVPSKEWTWTCAGIFFTIRFFFQILMVIFHSFPIVSVLCMLSAFFLSLYILYMEVRPQFRGEEKKTAWMTVALFGLLLAGSLIMNMALLLLMGTSAAIASLF